MCVVGEDINERLVIPLKQVCCVRMRHQDEEHQEKISKKAELNRSGGNSRIYLNFLLRDRDLESC